MTFFSKMRFSALKLGRYSLDFRSNYPDIDRQGLRRGLGVHQDSREATCRLRFHNEWGEGSVAKLSMSETFQATRFVKETSSGGVTLNDVKKHIGECCG